MILYSKYIEAKKVVDEYNEQMNNSVIRVSDLTVNQKVTRSHHNSSVYWVSEILGEDVLLRTTENENDPEYNDIWVNISDIRLVEYKNDLQSIYNKHAQKLASLKVNRASCKDLKWTSVEESLVDAQIETLASILSDIRRLMKN